MPNVHYHAPQVVGVVTSDGRPLANAQVRLTSAFSEERRHASADEAGRFEVKAISKLRLVASFVGDPLYAYSLIITVDGQNYEGWDEGVLPGYAPSQIQLVCDIAKPIKLRRGERFCAQVIQGKVLEGAE